MSLDFYLTRVQPTTVYSGNLTHNLTGMAEAAGIYEVLWRPEEVGITKAYQAIEKLRVALDDLRSNPDEYMKFNSPNGWGQYEHFVEFVVDVLNACKTYPDADVGVSR